MSSFIFLRLMAVSRRSSGPLLTMPGRTPPARPGSAPLGSAAREPPAQAQRRPPLPPSPSPAVAAGGRHGACAVVPRGRRGGRAGPSVCPRVGGLGALWVTWWSPTDPDVRKHALAVCHCFLQCILKASCLLVFFSYLHTSLIYGACRAVCVCSPRRNS